MSQLGALSPPLEVACVRSLRFSRWPVSSLSAPPGVRGRSTLRLVRASGSDSGSGTGRSGTESAPSGYLKLGGTLSPNLLIGGETNGWTKSVSGTTLTAGNASLALYYYPQATGGFFLRGGVGVAELSGGGSSETGFGLVTGVGYDVRVARNTSITPVANFNWGAPESGVKQHVFQIALGITFH